MLQPAAKLRATSPAIYNSQGANTDGAWAVIQATVGAQSRDIPRLVDLRFQPGPVPDLFQARFAWSINQWSKTACFCSQNGNPWTLKGTTIVNRENDHRQGDSTTPGDSVAVITTTGERRRWRDGSGLLTTSARLGAPGCIGERRSNGGKKRRCTAVCFLAPRAKS